MSQFTDAKKTEWSSIAAPRAKARSEYYGGPKSGPGIWHMYTNLFAELPGGRSDLTVAVMGATPELRDLALENGCRLIAVDQNKDVVGAMSEAMKHKHHPHERVLIANWLDLPLADASVDIVIGDAITNNVSPEEHGALFQSIQRVLKPGGHMLLRELTRDESIIRLPLKEIIQRAHAEGWHRFDLFFAFYCYSSDGGLMPEKEYIDMARLKQKLEEEIYGRGLLQPEEEKMFKQFVAGSVKSVFVPEPRILAAAAPYFHLEKTSIVNDYRFCQYFKFYLWQAKSH